MTVNIDRAIYSDSCISRAVYSLSGQYSINRATADVATEQITMIGGDDETMLKALLERLNDYKLREIIDEQTRDIRTLLYAKAFMDADDEQ